MAEEIVKLIKIETSDGERSVKSLKKEMADLRDALLNVEKGGEEWQKIVQQLVKDEKDYNDVTKATKTTIDAAADSIVGMEKEYKSLYNAYRLLTEAERNTPFGKDMAEQLTTLSNKLNEAKKNVGNFKDNIGRYSESMVSALSSVSGVVSGGMVNAFNGLNASMKLVSANPIMAMLTLLISLANKVSGAIKGSEETQMRWNEAMAAFKPITEGVVKIIDSLTQSIVKTVEWVAKLISKISALSKSARDLAKDQNDLTLKTREYNEANAEANIRIQQLRDEAASTTDVTERMKLLTEAKELQRGIDERNLELAKQRLANLEEEAKRLPNDTAANEALSKAKIDVANAEAAVSKNAREYSKQITGLTEKEDKLNASLVKTKTILEQIEEDLLKEIDKMDFSTNVTIKEDTPTNSDGKASAAMKYRLDLLKEVYENEKKMLEYSVEDQRTINEQKKILDQKYYDDRKKYMEEALKAETDPTKVLEIQRSINALKLEEEQKAAKERIDIIKNEEKSKIQLVKSINSVMGSLSNSYEEYIKAQVESGKLSEAEGERQFNFVKALNYAQVLMNGIAAGWAAFKGITESTGGWGTIAAASEMAAVVASSIASATQISRTTLGGTSVNNSAPIIPAAATPVINETRTPYQITRNLTTAEEEERLNQPIHAYVIDHEIADGLDKYNARKTESSF